MLFVPWVAVSFGRLWTLPVLGAPGTTRCVIETPKGSKAMLMRTRNPLVPSATKENDRNTDFGLPKGTKSPSPALF